MQAAGRVIGHVAQPDAAGPAPLSTTSTAPTTRTFPWWLRPPPSISGSFLLRQLISVSSTSTRPASGLRSGASMLQRSLAQSTTLSYRSRSELRLWLQCRDPVGVGGHQIGGPEPSGQRQLGVMHNGCGSDRGLAATAGALKCSGLGLQSPGFATTAARTNKPVGPTRRDQILRARCLVAEALLELDKRTGKVCHMVIAQNGTCS